MNISGLIFNTALVELLLRRSLPNLKTSQFKTKNDFAERAKSFSPKLDR